MLRVPFLACQGSGLAQQLTLDEHNCTTQHPELAQPSILSAVEGCGRAAALTNTSCARVFRPRTLRIEFTDTISSISAQGTITMTKGIPFLRREVK